MLNEFLSYNKFLKNKYYFTYLKLVKKIISENRIYDSNFHENHHILPKSFGGTVMIPFTFKEHYIAHLLLTKFTISDDYSNMTFALYTFFHFDRNRRLGLNQSSVIYENHKKRFIELCKLRSIGLNNNMADTKIYTFKSPDNNILNLTRWELNQLETNLTSHDVNSLIRVYKNPKKWISKGWSIFIPELNMFTDEIPKTKNKTMEKNKICEHCNKSINLGNYSRWHGDNCKLKTSL